MLWRWWNVLENSSNNEKTLKKLVTNKAVLWNMISHHTSRRFADFWTGHWSIYAVSFLLLSSVSLLEWVYDVLGTLWTTSRQAVACPNNTVSAQLPFWETHGKWISRFPSIKSKCFSPNKWNSYINYI